MSNALTSPEDLRQDYALERAEAAVEGRNPRPRQWVRADRYRAAFGRGTDPRMVNVTSEEGIAADYAPQPDVALSLREQGLLLAGDLPYGPVRTRLMMILRCLGAGAVERVRAWRCAHPGRSASDGTIARDVELSREAVSRAASEAGLRRQYATRRPRLDGIKTEQIIAWVRAHPTENRSGRELAEQFGCTRRTVVRARALAKRGRKA